jgi:hypothetical protein
MPNWCENYLTVHGRERDVTEFVERARGSGPRYKQHLLNYFQDLNNSGTQEQYDLCFHSLVPVPERLLARTYGSQDEESARAKPLEGQSFSPHYEDRDWEVFNWGCKCGPHVVALNRLGPEEMSYDFDTPWTPPLEFVKRASLLFPLLIFTLKFCEPNTDLEGWCVVQCGQLKEIR